MERIIVVGCPGGGKSTFSLALGGITGLPICHLDRLNWNADGTSVPKSLFRERLARAMTQPRWIIDGNYMGTMEDRLRACDTVFFLDYPLEVCLEGARSRQGKERADMPWVEPVGEMDAEFLAFIRDFNAVSRPKILALLGRYGDREIHVFRARAEADAFLASLRAAEEGARP